MLFDTHAHLTDERFADDLPGVVDRATAAGVEGIVCVATTAADSERCIEVAARFPHMFASVGIQPNHVAEAQPVDWDAVVRLADQPKVSAIGETGLDRHWDLTPLPQQEEHFIRHLELAKKKALPVIIHCREAEADTVRMLRAEFDRYGPIRGIMHSYSGDWITAEACLAVGLFISFAGMVTYKSAANLREVAARIPLDRILVETDAPYLAPVPLRGKRNEPAFVVHTSAVLAAERGMPAGEFAEHCTKNARTVFPTITPGFAGSGR